MLLGTTVIYHDKMDKQTIHNCSTKDCYELNLNYFGSLDQISSLIDSSESCQQNIEVKIFKETDTEY